MSSGDGGGGDGGGGGGGGGDRDKDSDKGGNDVPKLCSVVTDYFVDSETVATVLHGRKRRASKAAQQAEPQFFQVYI
jgi:hypothetical protein